MKFTKDVRDQSYVERIGPHSHIIGLGLDANLNPRDSSDGLVGQKGARRAAGIILRMIKTGTGKTAIAHGISKSLGVDIPFVSVAGSEDVSKTEQLTQMFRKSINVKIKESLEVIIGEVVEIEFERPTGAAGKNVGKLVLKTTEMETLYDLGEKMIDALSQKNIEKGDVIQINKKTGSVVRLGRSYENAQDFDANDPNVKFIPCPTGELQQSKEMTHTLNLHELDVINSRSRGFQALFTGDTGEIKVEVRDQIDKKVYDWVETGKATIVPGVLFIDEVHMLDNECFSYVNRMMESELAPIIVVATNRGITTVRGTEDRAPHGIPLDLLDRLLIVKTEPYSKDDVKKILELRLREEDIQFEKKALTQLAAIGYKTSLRYAINLIAFCDILASQRVKKKGGKKGRRNTPSVTSEDINTAYRMFSDVQRSVEYLEKSAGDGWIQEEEIE